MNHLARAAVAVLVGGSMVLAFPPFGVWVLAVLAPGAVTLLVREQPLKRSALYGLLAGLGFFVPLLYWTGLEVGPIPWLLLAALEAAFFVPLAVATTLVQRLPLWPLWVAALWVAAEAVRGRVPYGGLTWGKLAFAQADSPLIGLAALGGSVLVSFAAALAGALLAWAVVRRHWWRSAGAVLAAGAVTTVGVLVSPPAPTGETVTVATVQGSTPGKGLEFNTRARAITGNHVDATHDLAADVHAGRVAQPDFVVWPENSSDISPFHDRQTYDAIDAAVKDIGVPVLVSAIVPTEDEQNVKNTTIVWDPVSGPGDTYVKRHPMPFGEYIPFRSVAERITDAVRRQPRDHLPGDEVGVLAMGSTVIGNVICFEVGFDGIVRDAVAGGGQILTVQTNNATFGDSPMTEQHLAQSRLRAVEHGRTVIVSALAGVSAIIAPDGTVLDRAELFTRDVMVADVDLSDATTLATTLGPWPEWIITAAGLVAAAAALALDRRRARATAEAHRPGRPDEPVSLGVS